MLAEILIKTPEQRIFSLFVMNPDRPFYLREIAKRLNISLGATHGALVSLQKTETLATRTAGKTKLFELETRNSPAVLASFRVLNAVLILEPLVELLKNLSKKIILYGSYAKGTFTQESDLDLFIVSAEREEVLGHINDFLRNTEIDIRPVIKGQAEWINLERTDPEFFHEVANGLPLWEEQISESGF
jgi:predicted RNase H-like nuclease (RuvC/YqgF family)